MEDVYSGTAGVNEAAQMHDVSPTMLKNRISGRVKHGTNSGPKRYLKTGKKMSWHISLRYLLLLAMVKPAEKS